VDGDGARPLFSGGLSARFMRRVVTIPPHTAYAYEREEWRDALVVLESGEIELHTWCGNRRRLGTGSVFWLDGMPVRMLSNRGECPAVLVAVSRSVES
jgi:quercetin dioxygenase-like cupin family protein